MLEKFLPCLWLLWACVAPACRSAAPAPAPSGFTLVLLRTGPHAERLTDQQRKDALGGHFANMTRLAKEQRLLLAGPFGRERADSTLRGLFVLDTDDEARARQWATTDPAVQAGMFTLDCHSLRTDVDLRAVLSADLARLAAAEAAGRTPPPGEGARNYVLLTVDRAEQAAAVLAGQPFVVAMATVDGQRGLCWLDAVDLAAARDRLQPFAERLGAHQLDAWFGSGALAAHAAEIAAGVGR